jgi:hypothetical protein
MSVTQKLVALGIERDIAEKLTANGIMTPRAIREMSKTRLKVTAKLTEAEAVAVKARFEHKAEEKKEEKQTE